MSELLDLKPNKGRVKKSKRLGRGNASGKGTYAGKGVKGQTARSGGKRRPGFEGGQTPFIRKMPKLKGFRNINQVTFQVVNVSALNIYEDNDVVDIVSLYDKKLISSNSKPVKILGDGELTKKLEIKADKISQSAQEKITKASGSFQELMVKVEKVKKLAKKVKNLPKKAK